VKPVQQNLQPLHQKKRNNPVKSAGSKKTITCKLLEEDSSSFFYICCAQNRNIQGKTSSKKSGDKNCHIHLTY
jgi:hypothetical protein